MRKQEIESEAFWQKVADDPERNVIPGLLSSDHIRSSYRDRAEKKVLAHRLGSALRSDMNILEVGCGGGRWTTWLAQQCKRILATDISERMVSLAKESAQKQGLKNIQWQVASFEKLKYNDRFDLVYLGCCLQYMDMESIREALKNLSSVVNDDSLLLSRDTISLTGRSWHRSERYQGEDPAFYRTIEEYQEVMREAGWEMQDSWRTYIRPMAWRMRKFLPPKLLERLLDRALRSAEKQVEAFERKPNLGRKTHRHKFFVYKRIKS